MSAPESTRKKIHGILGGTFDPIHYAHLRLAEEIKEELNMEHVHLLPSSAPPHRDKPTASPEQRLKMLQIATESNQNFIIDEREIHRPGVSYTVDTLRDIRKENPRGPVALIMGLDAFSKLTTWHEWEEIFSLAHLVIAERAGFESQRTEKETCEIFTKKIENNRISDKNLLFSSSAGYIYFFKFTGLYISSTILRNKIALDMSLRYLLPPAVIEYIKREKLYK